MKKLILAIAALFVLTACESKEDPADRFEGTYALSIWEIGTWGSSVINLNSQGSAVITKVGSDRVKMTGSFSTYGTVIGNNVYFEATTSSSSDGTLKTTYNTGTLDGNTLYLSANMNGSLRYGGILYPYASVVSITGSR